MAKKFHDEKLNDVLKQISGKGPYTWAFVRSMYYGSKRKNAKFGRHLMQYVKYTDRIMIRRPYDVSESPMIEVKE